jgi:prevent-host-death family protein
MGRVPEIIPISDLRQDAAAVVKRARSKRQPIVITQRGRAAAVMVGVEEYERAEHEREILLLLARGEQEIAAGIGSDLDAVLAEADAMIARAEK